MDKKNTFAYTMHVVAARYSNIHHISKIIHLFVIAKHNLSEKQETTLFYINYSTRIKTVAVCMVEGMI